MKHRHFAALTLIILFISNCNSKPYPKADDKKYGLQGIWFKNPPVLIDSVLDQDNYDGFLLKVYEINIDKDEILSFDSLLQKGYMKLPFHKEDFSEIPESLKKYIKYSDTGYYSGYEKNSFGWKYLILNISKRKFILYDFGILEDLKREDSLKRFSSPSYP